MKSNFFILILFILTTSCSKIQLTSSGPLTSPTPLTTPNQAKMSDADIAASNTLKIKHMNRNAVFLINNPDNGMYMYEFIQPNLIGAGNVGLVSYNIEFEPFSIPVDNLSVTTSVKSFILDPTVAQDNFCQTTLSNMSLSSDNSQIVIGDSNSLLHSAVSCSFILKVGSEPINFNLLFTRKLYDFSLDSNSNAYVIAKALFSMGINQTTSSLDFNQSWVSALTPPITAIPAGVFNGLTALTSLNLGYHDLSGLTSGFFSGLSSLKNLDLTNTNLSSLPVDVFSGLTSLVSRQICLSR